MNLKGLNIFKILKYFIFYFVSTLLQRNKFFNVKKNAFLFVNTGQIGDLVVSSLILENDKIFLNRGCFFLIDQNYKEIFSSYIGSIKILTFNKIKYRYSLLYRLKILKQIRQLNINIAYNITAARGFVNDELTLLSGANNYFTTSSDNKYLGRYVCNKFNKKYDAIILNDMYNEYEKTVLLLCKLSGLSKNEIDIRNIKTFNVNERQIIKENCIVISPFTSNRIKNWAESNYSYLISQLSKYIKIVLLGSDKQKRGLNRLKSNFNNVDYKICSLGDVAQVIKMSRLFVGNDSGLTHIAYRLGIPVVAILGGGCYGKFLPYMKLNNDSSEFFYKLDCFGCDWDCIYKEPYCISKIQKKVVLEKILSILKLN